MIGPFEMIIAIVVVTSVAGVANDFMKIRNASRGDEDAERQITALRGEIRDLRERVRTLERITTDSDVRLRDEISRLA